MVGKLLFDWSLYTHPEVTAEFEPLENYEDPFGKAVKEMRNQGFDVYYGRWLVTGHPRVVLVDNFYKYIKDKDFLGNVGELDE